MSLRIEWEITYEKQISYTVVTCWTYVTYDIEACTHNSLCSQLNVQV